MVGDFSPKMFQADGIAVTLMLYALYELIIFNKIYIFFFFEIPHKSGRLCIFQDVCHCTISILRDRMQ